MTSFNIVCTCAFFNLSVLLTSIYSMTNYDLSQLKAISGFTIRSDGSDRYKM